MMNNTAKCWLPQPKICLLAVVQVHCWHSRNPGDIQHPLTSLGVQNWRLTNYNSNKTCQRTIQITNSDIKNWNKVNKNSRKVSLSVSLEVLLRIREIKVTSSDVNAHIEVRYSHCSLVVGGGGVLWNNNDNFHNYKNYYHLPCNAQSATSI